MSPLSSRWPEKPAGSRWTDEQWAAVAAEGSHVLVAAAAGSGKTAVLVERMIRRIADPERPLSVDALLVATFTKAAAAEMKARIRRALEEELERHPGARHLERQLALLPQAAITTLHSFCLEIVEQYAPLIGLDPGFRIANETEAGLLRMDTLDELFEETYGEEGETGALSRLADRFGGERSDEPLHRLVLELHDYAASHPWPEHWLRTMAGQFRTADAANLLRSHWARCLLDDTRLRLQGAVTMLRTGLRICGEPGGPAPYAETLQEDLQEVERLLIALEAGSWEAWQEAFASCAFGRLKPCRGDAYEPDLQERVKQCRNDARKVVAKAAEEWLVRTPERYAEEMRALAPDMETLAELVIRFGKRYEAAKRAKGLLDFGDLEHYALKILRDPSSTPERSLPSAAAIEYRNRFAEIYLDEYQDTNEVQEAIVSLIAREGPGNVFMVGDVKQSIYRFRLAEPGLFLDKYRTYDLWPGHAESEERAGLRIDLARNFRSRREIVEAVNAVFRLIMREPVGEMEYDSRAELIYGGGYPEPAGTGNGGTEDRGDWSVELIVLDASEAGKEPDAQEEDSRDAEEKAEDGGDPPDQAEDLEAAQLEARCVAAEIRRLMGESGDRQPFAVFDSQSGLYRPVQYRDIVILHRSAGAAAPVWLEELKAAGIPAYAELATGYFAATEVDVMLSLLAIIDNPRQDIPLAGVLRSPIVGWTEEELARIRLCDRRGEFWDALHAAAKDETVPQRLRDAAAEFVERLSAWRDFARREPLGELLWMLYRETGYYDFVGGLPGGTQRQANLRALVDRARGFERSSRFRGLFRFLRFLGRMRDSGADLGEARALGEGENVVRLMSIHKSKGLEFPVVFVAGIGRPFNRQDLNGSFLKHKTLGFGPRMLEPDTRVAYPTLPQLAIRRKLAAEMLAEEMRVLYVALTRPKEKLFLVGSVKDAAKAREKWQLAASLADGKLPDFTTASASCYLDWLGPSALLFPLWNCRVVPVSAYVQQAAAAQESGAVTDELWNAVVRGERVNVPESPAGAQVREALSWRYPHERASKLAAKTSITAWKKRLADLAADRAGLAGEDSPEIAHVRSEAEGWEPTAWALASSPGKPESVTRAGSPGETGSPVVTFRLRRPRFLGEKKLTPAERGTAYHLVMQHLPLQPGIDEADISELLDRMEARKLLTPEQRTEVAPEAIAAFCRSSLFERMCRAERIWREVPFTYGVPARDAYDGLQNGDAGDTVIIQGVVDCLFAEGDGLVLVDYKTDHLGGIAPEAAAEKHRFQVEKYAEAVGRIIGQPVREAYVYFFEGGRAVKLEETRQAE